MMMTLMMSLCFISCEDQKLKEINESIKGKTFVLVDKDNFYTYSIIRFKNDNTCDVTGFINNKIDTFLSTKSESYEFNKVGKSYEALVGKHFFTSLGDGFYSEEGTILTLSEFNRRKNIMDNISID